MDDRSDSGARIDAVRALESDFGELMARIRRIISENATSVSPGMLPGAYKVFTTIVARESVTQSALAEILLVDKGQLSRTVRELEQLGLIQRSPDPSDGRSSLLSPTEHGRERLAVARRPQEDSLARALDEWDLEDIRNFGRLLRALTAGVRPDSPTER